MKKQTKALLVLLAALCLLTACKKEVGPLEVYSLGEGEEDTVVALDSILAPDEAILYSIDAPTDKAIAEQLEISHTYHYRKMADPAELAARYVEVLRGSEQGFQIIDTENRRVEEEPDTDVLAGSVILGKAGAETEEGGKRILRVVVGWSEYAVAVQVAYVDGKILPPLKPEDEKTEGGGAAGAQGTGVSDHLAFINGLNPSQLGLEGESMSEYMVFPQQGWVQVEDMLCRKVIIYRQDTQTAVNVIVGTFYLSSDMTQLYKEDSDGQLTPVQLN